MQPIFTALIGNLELRITLAHNDKARYSVADISDSEYGSTKTFADAPGVEILRADFETLLAASRTESLDNISHVLDTNRSVACGERLSLVERLDDLISMYEAVNGIEVMPTASVEPS